MFPYTDNNQSEKEIKKKIPFTTAPKTIKYLEINLMKEVICIVKLQNIDEINEGRYKYKVTLCSWIGRFNYVKILMLSRAIYRFKGITTKIPLTCFTEIEKQF